MRQKDLFSTIRKKKEIQKLFRSGKKYKSRNIYIRYRIIPETQLLPVDVLFAVAKKSGKAHYRNYLKRSLKEAVFLFLKQKMKPFSEINSFTLQMAVIPVGEFEHISLTDKINEIGSFFRIIVNEYDHEKSAF